MKNEKQIKKVAKKALEVLEQLESMKHLYNELDSLTEELRALNAKSIEINGTVLQVVDNFSSKNTVFKTTSVKRFELKKIA